ncbi:DoxX family membrane protein [Polymorphum gilvum]|uniref:DoxX subfamily, putative n=1 Tax=Polymorphum gilvum (strain LMG 25793 / CGMCC 1.9160 / SL003B-26A1) TaxID=991905 RepID=F2IWI3_POLGS|nr:DoxX family membrane protein [Polymorphum gilvum]ADZ69282.1 DoxX subfamily, putative [Polymorphum gilvum SL003B-26A1]
MSALIGFSVRLYVAVFGGLERLTDGWFVGLAARFVFASVLLVYFLNSALTKVGPGPFGFLEPSVGAYAQILPAMMEAVSYDTGRIAFFPYGLIVLLGTWAEFLLPVMVVAGLFTRAASLGMIGFVIVMSYVDITGHHVGAATVGALFDGNPGAMIADQRLLWAFVLLVLVLKGPGGLSLDGLLGRLWRGGKRYY